MTFHRSVADSPDVIPEGLAEKATMVGVPEVDVGVQEGSIAMPALTKSNRDASKSDFFIFTSVDSFCN